MSSRKSPSSQPSHRLCLTSGHDWKLAATLDYRTCKRTGCRAAEHLSAGTWMSVSRLSRRVTPTTPEMQTGLLWDEQTLLSEHLHPQQRALERKAEQGWHKFLHDEALERRRFGRRTL